MGERRGAIPKTRGRPLLLGLSLPLSSLISPSSFFNPAALRLHIQAAMLLRTLLHVDRGKEKRRSRATAAAASFLDACTARRHLHLLSPSPPPPFLPLCPRCRTHVARAEDGAVLRFLSLRPRRLRRRCPSVLRSSPLRPICLVSLPLSACCNDGRGQRPAPGRRARRRPCSHRGGLARNARGPRAEEARGAQKERAVEEEDSEGRISQVRRRARSLFSVGALCGRCTASQCVYDAERASAAGKDRKRERRRERARTARKSPFVCVSLCRFVLCAMCG